MTAPHIPLHITDAESVILTALWQHGPLTPTRLISDVRSGRDWGDSTIKTLIARLMHKGAIRSQRDDGILRYHAQITHDSYAEAEIRDLIKRLFGNDAEAFTAFIAERIKI
ncbi:BlaI/MecI/CopY family transcriptional regulator [Asticcacaulis machinosus]|uniref:BlaI/MecI/CopY family transcriptional regulator n=1 Tax=Asticcacaulis machinosus TaxID=2984211 RepID=A0ABT5HHL2_9CAUL|nr:BlaI/MecI/CopY family transcriptional regulator [Asticcacaulis machinosus]